MKIVIGSRGSALALWQARHIQATLQEMGAEATIEIIKTSGDKIQDVPLSKVGGKGLFTKEIEEALLDGSIDLAVHSMKDVPTELPAGLILSGIPQREEARDALIGARVEDLRDGLRVGTSSLRRSSQLLARVPGLKVEMLRGNVDTRLRKLDEGQYDAIVLAAAGLRRLGWADRIRELIPADVMCPAVGQGALAIETVAGFALPPVLDDAATHTAVLAERAVLHALGGGCQVPIGAHATVSGEQLKIQGIVAAADGSRIIRASAEGEAARAAELGRSLAAELMELGARELLEL